MDHNVEVLWCGNARTGRSNGWSFPPAVRRLLKQLCAGRSVLHLFGGISDFGVRLDVDPAVSPDVIGDAWLPPFKQGSVDVVILDPPYTRINQTEKRQLLLQAAYVARHSIIWIHTLWIAGDRFARYNRGWLVRVGDNCQVRCIQRFDCTGPKPTPVTHFVRGPAVRYNRWLNGQGVLIR